MTTGTPYYKEIDYVSSPCIREATITNVDHDNDRATVQYTHTYDDPWGTEVDIAILCGMEDSLPVQDIVRGYAKAMALLRGDDVLVMNDGGDRPKIISLNYDKKQNPDDVSICGLWKQALPLKVYQKRAGTLYRLSGPYVSDNDEYCELVNSFTSSVLKDFNEDDLEVSSGNFLYPGGTSDVITIIPNGDDIIVLPSYMLPKGGHGYKEDFRLHINRGGRIYFPEYGIVYNVALGKRNVSIAGHELSRNKVDVNSPPTCSSSRTITEQLTRTMCPPVHVDDTDLDSDVFRPLWYYPPYSISGNTVTVYGVIKYFSHMVYSCDSIFHPCPGWPDDDEAYYLDWSLEPRINVVSLTYTTDEENHGCSISSPSHSIMAQDQTYTRTDDGHWEDDYTFVSSSEITTGTASFPFINTSSFALYATNSSLHDETNSTSIYSNQHGQGGGTVRTDGTWSEYYNVDIVANGATLGSRMIQDTGDWHDEEHSVYTAHYNYTRNRTATGKDIVILYINPDLNLIVFTTTYYSMSLYEEGNTNGTISLRDMNASYTVSYKVFYNGSIYSLKQHAGSIHLTDPTVDSALIDCQISYGWTTFYYVKDCDGNKLWRPYHYPFTIRNNFIGPEAPSNNLGYDIATINNGANPYYAWEQPFTNSEWRTWPNFVGMNYFFKRRPYNEPFVNYSADGNIIVGMQNVKLLDGDDNEYVIFMINNGIFQLGISDILSQMNWDQTKEYTVDM